MVKKPWDAGGACLVEAKVEIVLRYGGREDEGQVEGVGDDGGEKALPLTHVGDFRCLRVTERAEREGERERDSERERERPTERLREGEGEMDDVQS